MNELQKELGWGDQCLNGDDFRDDLGKTLQVILMILRLEGRRLRSHRYTAREAVSDAYIGILIAMRTWAPEHGSRASLRTLAITNGRFKVVCEWEAAMWGESRSALNRRRHALDMHWKILPTATAISSLAPAVNGEQNETPFERVADSHDDMQRFVDLHSASESVGTLLNQSGLAHRSIEIVRARFGIGCEPQTLEAVGRDYGLTSERIRQIEEKALQRIAGMSKLTHKRAVEADHS